MHGRLNFYQKVEKCFYNKKKKMEEQEFSESLDDIEHKQENISNNYENTKGVFKKKIGVKKEIKDMLAGIKFSGGILLLILQTIPNTIPYKITRNIISFLLFLSSVFYFYLCFAEFLYLNFYAFVYQWISILAKNDLVHIVFSIFAALSDFGYFILLFHISFQIIKEFIEIIKKIWKLPFLLFDFGINFCLSRLKKYFNIAFNSFEDLIQQSNVNNENL